MKTVAMPKFLRSTRFGFWVIVFTVAFVFLIPTQAQEQPQGIIRVGVNLVLVDATVKNKSGQIMADLKKEDFELREDGVAQKLDVFSKDELPLEVALVLDLSDSIEPFLGPLRDAANTALAALKPDDEVALFTFSTLGSIARSVHEGQKQNRRGDQYV